MRVRFRFSKLGKVRFTSHRDVARLWERALRRVQLPVARTEGFSPRPKVHFGLALSTGYESLAEYIDVDLIDDQAGSVDLAALPDRLSAALPEGLSVDAVGPVARGSKSLQEAVTSCVWRIELPELAASDLDRQLARLLAADRLVVERERKGKRITDDLRPAVRSLRVVDQPAAGSAFEAELATEQRTIRPAELLAAFDPPQPDAIEAGGRVCRLRQLIEDHGATSEPLEMDATWDAHARVRAS